MTAAAASGRGGHPESAEGGRGIPRTTPMGTRIERNEHAVKVGFTLVELLIVLAIIGILLTAAISSYQLARVRSRDGKRATDVSQISTALALYEGRHQQFPADIYAPSGGSPPGLAPEFMNLVPRDPLAGVAYAYAAPAARNEYHLGATIEGDDSSLRDADADFDSAILGWDGGFRGGDTAGPCVVGQQGSFCYDIVEQK